MTYSIEMIKANGKSAFVAGEFNLYYIAKVEVTFTAAQQINNTSADYDSAPYFIPLVSTEAGLHDAYFDRFDIYSMIGFLKPPNNLRFGFTARTIGDPDDPDPYLSDHHAYGLVAEGSVTAGQKLDIYLFAPFKPTVAEANQSYGMSLYDAAGNPYYTTKFDGLILDSITTHSFTGGNKSDGIGLFASISGSFNVDHAFYIPPIDLFYYNALFGNDEVKTILTTVLGTELELWHRTWDGGSHSQTYLDRGFSVMSMDPATQTATVPHLVQITI